MHCAVCQIDSGHLTRCHSCQDPVCPTCSNEANVCDPCGEVGQKDGIRCRRYDGPLEQIERCLRCTGIVCANCLDSGICTECARYIRILGDILRSERERALFVAPLQRRHPLLAAGQLARIEDRCRALRWALEVA